MSIKTVRFAVQKLVRDHIPLVTSDERVIIETVPLESDAEFITALKQKLIEEAYEVRDAERHELIEELADVQEVMEEIMRLHAISSKQLEEAQQRKKELRGGFAERLFITTLEAPIDSKAYEYCIKYPKKYPILKKD